MVSGIERMSAIAAMAAMSLTDGAALLAPAYRAPPDPERERSLEQERARREKHAHQRRALERKERRQREDELRERLLRQSIVAGRDDRADKYLHAAARRRREAERASLPTPDPSSAGT